MLKWATHITVSDLCWTEAARNGVIIFSQLVIHSSWLEVPNAQETRGAKPELPEPQPPTACRKANQLLWWAGKESRRRTRRRSSAPRTPALWEWEPNPLWAHNREWEMRGAEEEICCMNVQQWWAITQRVDDAHGQLNTEEHEGPASGSQPPCLHAVVLPFFCKNLLQDTAHGRQWPEPRGRIWILEHTVCSSKLTKTVLLKKRDEMESTPPLQRVPPGTGSPECLLTWF